MWQIGGGTVWGWVTYDPATDVVFYGTGNPGPWNPDQRPGANKWTCTVFARRLSDPRHAPGRDPCRRGAVVSFAPGAGFCALVIGALTGMRVAT